ncbi:hypothetical protein SAMN05518849_101539 [Sphingobium sp. AP50]|nr:hypothetical protein SAMN05518849_101539 [Sphingobium sp. AP50]
MANDIIGAVRVTLRFDTSDLFVAEVVPPRPK